jgi:hypothetical protein
MLPLSREHEQLRRLKRSLAVYRLTFGQPRQEDLLAWLESQKASGGLDSEQINDLGIRLDARGGLLEPNEDPEVETDAEVDAPTLSLRAGSVEAQLRAFTKSADALRAVLRLYLATFDAIPHAAISPHWTLNQRRQCLRLNLGSPEVLTLYDGTLTVGVEGLNGEAIAKIRGAGATVGPLPYDRLRRLAPRARWVDIEVGRIAECVELLEAGITALVSLDTRLTRAPTRQYLSVEAVQTMGRLAGASAWARWRPE